MAYNLEEQEQLESMKAWWRRYGNLIMGVATVALLAYAGWNGWQWWQARQTAEAAVLYDEVQKALASTDIEKIQRSATDMTQRYGGTAYAELSAMTAATALLEAGKTDGAKTLLQWVVDKARRDEFRHLARVRLAGLLLDEKSHDEALKLLSAEPSAAYAGLYADRRGDILWAQGKVAEARVAYKLALEKTDTRSNGPRQLIQMKLDALGDA